MNDSIFLPVLVNTLRPRQNGRHFADDIFKWIFLNENVWFPIKIALKFVPKGLINNIPALVQIMAWCRQGDKPLSETMMVILPTHICVTRPQWVENPRIKTCWYLTAAKVLQITDHFHSCFDALYTTVSMRWGFCSYINIKRFIQSNTNDLGYAVWPKLYTC